MDTLKIRAYHVRFGDAYLIEIPDKDNQGNTVIKYVLIDVGNAISKEGGKNDVFRPVVNDILQQLNGRPLDLYIMTHEHMDHVQGLIYANKKVITGNNLKERLNTQYSWMTASAADDYYDKHPKAKKAFDTYLASFNSIEKYVSSLKNKALSPLLETLLYNNNPNRTKDCVDFLKKLAPKNKTFFIHRETKLKKGKHHNFNEAKFEIWGPEEDTSIYYGRLKPTTLNINEHNSTDQKSSYNLTPPPGVDAGAFYKLINQRNSFTENLLAIDKAKNNTSIVFSLEWRGWRLLFPGDAEEKSWKIMDRAGLLKPVHFLKVGHHGSHNGTPHTDILNKILPVNSPDNKMRYSVVSTFEGNYNGVPHQNTLELIRSRCDNLYELTSNSTIQPGEYVDIKFEG